MPFEPSKLGPSMISKYPSSFSGLSGGFIVAVAPCRSACSRLRQARRRSEISKSERLPETLSLMTPNSVTTAPIISMVAASDDQHFDHRERGAQAGGRRLETGGRRSEMGRAGLADWHFG